MAGALPSARGDRGEGRDALRRELRRRERDHGDRRRDAGDLHRDRCAVRPGDEVIVFEPVYDSYVPSILLNGGTPVYARLSLPDYRPDWAEVRALVTPRTRMIVINSPHNPSGSTLCGGRLAELEAIVRDTDIVVRERRGLRAHGVRRPPPRERGALPRRWRSAASSCRASARPITSPAGRSRTAWRRATLMTEFRKAHQFVVFCVHTPSQLALADFMQNKDWYAELAQFYEAKRDFFRARSPVRDSSCCPAAAPISSSRATAGSRTKATRRSPAPHQGDRRRVDSGLGVLCEGRGQSGAALLLRQVRGDAGRERPSGSARCSKIRQGEKNEHRQGRDRPHRQHAARAHQPARARAARRKWSPSWSSRIRRTA